ncbi:MAG: DUF4367 domain-containing protein [Clostridiales bacterium]|nr:DUF4367 domain-containing protein [Clostridiales bacterium]MDY5513441.1 DUF4367 domain-containing protein [Candidatus Ventricola sp.]
MSKKEDSSILERLTNDASVEMMSDDLEQMLKDELAKPAEAIDGQLVDELLKALEPAEPDKAQAEKGWPRVLRALPRRRRSTRGGHVFLRFAAAAVLCVVVLTATGQRAWAIPWTLIQSLIAPIAETFGIVVNVQPTPAPDISSAYYADDIPSTQILYKALSDIPETQDGYPVRPDWLPDGFSFTNGSCFSDQGTQIYSLDFASGEAWLNFTVQFFSSDESVSSYEFEKMLDSPIEKPIGQYNVLLYSNDDDHLQSASWTYENVYYTLIGQIPLSDLISFVEHLN